MTTLPVATRLPLLLNRATTYNTISELTNQGYLIKTKVISGAQLYKLDLNKKEVQILIKVFNLVLNNITEKYKTKIKITA